MKNKLLADGKVTVKDAASHVNRSVRTIRRWAADGSLKTYKLASILVVDKAEVERVSKLKDRDAFFPKPTANR